MIAALIYLRLTSLKNLLWVRLRRLRQPRYLAGTVVGIAYFYFFFFRHTRGGGRPPNGGHAAFVLPQDPVPLLIGLGALGLFVVVVGMWVLPSTKPGLTFSEAEIAFLFPAPLSRRALIHYRMLSSQFSALLQSIFYALVFNSRTLFSGQALQVIVSWWAVLAIVSLHYQASSLTIARLVDRGVRPGLRRGVVLGIAAALLLGSLGSAWDGLQKLSATAGIDQWVAAIFNGGALPWLLWPFRLAIRPFFASTAGEFALALAPVLLLLVAHYVWVVRMNVSFEEASIEKAERRAARLNEMRLRGAGAVRVGPARAAGRRAPFDLARARGPEFAFLWKNLLSTSRAWFTPRGWLFTAVALVAISAAARQFFGHEYWKFGAPLATIGMIVGGAALVYGPLLTRLDLRLDLANADILKTYPLPGWRVLLGELLAPIAILSGLVWLGILAWYLGLLGQQPPALSPTWFGPAMRTVWALCAAAVAPVVVAMELLIPNAVPMLFPSWFYAVRTPGAGIDLMGQRLIFAFGQVFVVMLALLPAAGAAALLVFVTQWLIGPALAVIFASLAVTLVLAGELWCGLWWLGGRFEKLDLSTEPRP